jgi:hypothetical protein
MIELQSTVTCPECGHRAVETMPTDACRLRPRLRTFSARLTPKKGHCCLVLLLWFGALSADSGGAARAF